MKALNIHREKRGDLKSVDAPRIKRAHLFRAQATTRIA